MQLMKISAVFALSIVFAACGANKKKTEESQDPSSIDSLPTVTSTPIVIATATPTPAASPTASAPLATVWVASNTLRAVAGYDANGNFIKMIDLSTYMPSGAITSITFINKNTMILTADPGASGEKLIRVDLADNTVTNINTNWFQDATNFNNISMYKLLKWSSSKLIAVKSSAMIESLTYNISNNAIGRTGAPFINTGLTTSAIVCNLTTAQYAIPATYNNVTKLIGFSSGANARANIYGNIDTTPTCDASVNYVAGLVTANHVPVGAVQMPDGKVYVRYQFTSNPLIMRYSYDGLNLTNGTVVFSDSGFLNTTTSDRDLVALDDKNLLFANWQTNGIVKFNTSTGLAEFFIRDMFTASANAIGVRPAQ